MSIATAAEPACGMAFRNASIGHIDLDWNSYSQLSDYEQSAVIFHELIHLFNGGHHYGEMPKDLPGP